MPVGKHAGQRAKKNLKFGCKYAAFVDWRLSCAGRAASFERDDGSLEYTLSRADHASLALTLEDTVSDYAIGKAFAEARLNPENPWHWRILLQIFADAHYPRNDLKFRWTSFDLTELLAMSKRVEGQNPDWDENKRLKFLGNWLETIGKTSKSLPKKHLQRLLRMARDPKQNKILAATREQLLNGLRATIKKHTGSYPTDAPRITDEHVELMAVARVIAARKSIFRK